MSKFRPCIDLHQGRVKQIVGSSLSEDGEGPIENHVSVYPSEWFASRYQADGLSGGHVIKLGPGSEAAAQSALAAFPDGLQIGGGIDAGNAAEWLDAGASHVIVTSWLFDDSGRFLSNRLDQLVEKIGCNRIVVDLSCKRTPMGWIVAMNQWQTPTDLAINSKTLDTLSDRCDEFLIHAADMEGLCRGIDHELVELMGQWGKIPMTYAGGISRMDDVEAIASLGENRIDFTVGSALDLFGGRGIRYDSLLDWNQRDWNQSQP